MAAIALLARHGIQEDGTFAPEVKPGRPEGSSNMWERSVSLVLHLVLAMRLVRLALDWRL